MSAGNSHFKRPETNLITTVLDFQAGAGCFFSPVGLWAPGGVRFFAWKKHKAGDRSARITEGIMITARRILSFLLLLVIALSGASCNSGTPDDPANNGTSIIPPVTDSDNETAVNTENPRLTYTLPIPETDGNVSVETALAERRSHRQFQDKALSIDQISQVLWAAYGVTSPHDNPQFRGGMRTSPSAGATYPLEVYLVVGNVEGVEPGVYRYISDEHKIERVVAGDVRQQEPLASNSMAVSAPASIFYSAVFERTTGRYGEAGEQYVFIEVGHSAQNVYLQIEALGLGTCAVGISIVTDSHATYRELLALPANEMPMYLMPIGFKA